MIIYPFPDLDTCLYQAKQLWECWVVYDITDGVVRERSAGGIGFARQTIKKNGLAWLATRK